MLLHVTMSFRLSKAPLVSLNYWQYKPKDSWLMVGPMFGAFSH